ncbi:galactose mutarotase-like [Macrosteles quadrilineatus]|uniref:galactose mutarotase-like n=1 Tax=Macrosteles quadrilineatus TaxID=74068 RepID=UPI0023E23512|nr:galactose mutarotase-like [Macrosteles quadrilineatus]
MICWKIPIVLVCTVWARLASSGCVVRDVFGSYQGGTVHRYTLSGDNVEVQVIDYGATITSVRAPDSHGLLEDIMLGYDNLEGYFNTDNPYFGATIGRVANRIANGHFTLNGVEYNLFRNNGNNTLHGGLIGFDKKLWSSWMEGEKVVMEYTSPDGEEGFPGEVKVQVIYWMSGDTLMIEYNATSTKPTPINLTSHNYFNLAGQGAGPEGLYRHIISIKADTTTEVDSQFVPTGRLSPVAGTPLDLRQPMQLGRVIHHTPIDGYDYNYVLPHTGAGVIAIVEDPVSGRRLEVETTQPGLQFYTFNTEKDIQGKSLYTRHASISLEAQNFPDAINHPSFPNSVLGPGQCYHHLTKYRFSTARHNSGHHAIPTMVWPVLSVSQMLYNFTQL